MPSVDLYEHRPVLGLLKYFDEAQRHKNDHPAIISSMFKVSRKVKLNTFIVEFLQCLSIALYQNEKSPFANIALDFAAKFCCHNAKNVPEDDDDLFLAYVVDFVTKASNNAKQSVRLRVCEFISLLLASMSVEATISEDIFEVITQCMLDRAKDKLATVRVRALSALQRLQDPKNNECLVTKVFIFHMECDPSAEVRRHTLMNVAISPHSLPAVISRSRDISEIVRKETYQTISKIKAKRLRLRQRQEILTNGMSEASELVKDHVFKKLIPTWFDDCEKDYLKLLELICVEYISLDTVSTLLTSLFKRQASGDLLDLIKSWQNPDKVVPVDELTTGKAVMWLAVVKYFHEPPTGVHVDKEAVLEILPELTYFSNYIKQFRKKMDRNNYSSEFTFMRLLDIVLQFTLTDDERGREEMTSFVQEMLLSNETVNEEMIKILSRLLTFLVPDIGERLQIVALIISDIQHPLEDMEASKVNDSDLIEESISEMPNDFENLRINSTGVSTNVDHLDFQNIKMLPKCLLMLIEILKAKDVNTLHPTLDTLQKNFLSECFNVDESYVLCLAISALSLLNLISPEDIVKANFVKFLFYLELDQLHVSSLEAIFDQLIYYGLDICQFNIDKSTDKDVEKKEKSKCLDFNDDTTMDRKSIKHLFNRISDSLFSQVLHIRSIACQGFAKLLLTSRIKSSFVLAKLVILWFSPVLGSDSSVSQPLGIFFDLYAKKVPEAAEVILNALVPALEYLTSKNCDPQLASVDPTRVANLLLDSLKKTPPPSEGPSYHCQAANIICDEILNRGVRSEVNLCNALTKCFYHLQLPKSDKEFAEDLMDKLPFVLTKIEKLKERPLKKIANNFFSKLNTMWGRKHSTNASVVSNLQENKQSKSIETENSLLNYKDFDTSNVTMRRTNSSHFKISEPIIEEYSASEDGKMDSDHSEIIDDSETGVCPGTPESEDLGSDSEESQPSPPTRRKQRKLIF